MQKRKESAKYPFDLYFLLASLEVDEERAVNPHVTTAI
jgi:hypothetical protein